MGNQITFLMRTQQFEPKVYVGTYGKYNDGSIQGAWLDLLDYADKEDFLQACHELHKDEHDPEFMFQDFECFPKQWYSESHIADAFWDLKDDLSEMSEDMYNAFLAFMDVHGADDIDADALTEFKEKFQGFYDSERDFADQLAREFGYYDAMERIGLNPSYFDVDQYAVDLFHSYYFDSDTGAVFTR